MDARELDDALTAAGVGYELRQQVLAGMSTHDGLELLATLTSVGVEQSVPASREYELMES